MNHVLLWAEFVGLSTLVVLAGVRLVHYGDILSEKLGLGKALVGMLLIGWATSLPEMVLSAGAILSIGSPDMAIGNIFGSLAFNLGILSLLSIILYKNAHTGASHRTVTMSAGYSLLLILIFLGAAVAAYFGFSFGSVFTISPVTLVIVVIYLYSTRALYREDKKNPEEVVGEPEYTSEKLGLTIGKALMACGVIMAAGVYLAYTGDKMSKVYGLSQSVVGIFFLAIVSSLPELATTIAALRRGLFDMAAGNIFGSNIFNVAIVALCDLLYQKGPVLESLSRNEMPQQLAAGAVAVLVTAVLLIGLVLRSRKTGPTRTGRRLEMVIGGALYLVGMVLLVVLFGSV